ncbi:MAG: type IX secretion system sortase PorU [Bacteroidales bacterium]|nr:type IX secretion system sortase PorU [Bacteroidales bacterium]MCB8999371.1 type IX secretion system sortase PorU [Bacteroidales bacterium]MCB9013386.1 type IX secretion system sortase PorU [Bacteroidales bacterium]
MRYLLILLIFMSLEGMAQVWHTKRAIPYNNSESIAITEFSDFTSFRGQMSNDSSAFFPAYSELIDWKASNMPSDVSIIYPVYESFGGVLPDGRILDALSDTLRYSYSINYIKKKPFLQISVIPFRKNHESGKLERLKSFVIRTEASPGKISYEEGSKKALLSENSVLATGNWYKIKVPSSGIYKLSYDQISSMGVGNPANVQIFGWDGRVIPEDYRISEKDDLPQVPVYMNKGADGIFNSGDYILFYSKGSVAWNYDSGNDMFRHSLNPYSDYSYYFVTSGTSPVTVSDETSVTDDPIAFSDSYDFRIYHEKESENVLLSGKQWFGELFSLNLQQTFNFTVPGIITSQPMKILTQVMAKALDSSYFQLSYNGSLIKTLGIRQANLSDYTSTFGYTTQERAVVTASSSNISLKLKYLQPDISAKGWLDYIILNARCRLEMLSDMLEFRDKNVSGVGTITQFTLASADANTMVWDVTDQNAIRRIPASLNGTQLIFKTRTDELREFVAFKVNGNFPSPVITGKNLGLIPNQNLHAATFPDMVILTLPEFKDQAERLAAYRREKSKLDVLVVTPEEVYNEFSSGSPDISAIRNFMKMLYEKAGSDSTLMPRYLLLFGDGSFDNKGITTNGKSLLLTYQSDNSLSPVASYVSDDFFAMLDPGENMISGLLDIGVGRLPANNEDEAKLLVDKIIDYESPARMGDWRNTICFIGDDEDGNIHMTDADGMANYVEGNYPGFNINKIYLDAYKQVSTPTGQAYPDVNLAISEQVERGALIINYTGHGGIAGWAHEQILDINDIESWTNYATLPLFMTATCEFSRYDDHIIPSAGEMVLMSSKGGSIALFTTTRLVYSQPNRILNEKFYEIVFEKDKNGENYHLGDIMAYTKNKAGSGINKRNFTLLGDPSLRLSYPEFFVYADSLNGKVINSMSDSLQALRKISVSGHIADLGGNVLSDFNGKVFPTVYDKSVLQQTLANDGGSKKTFSIRNNIIYKGESTVNQGYFNFSFIVPKDISYAYGSGKLSFYAEDSLYDAAGANLDITVGGTYDMAEPDTQGPELKVYINSPTFRSGGICDENPVLYVEVSDEHGVNTTGNGIGHSITAMLDDNSQNLFFLNGYYQSYLDSYQGGIIQYPFSKLEPGHHTVNVKVWDIYNNSSTGSTDFVVIKTDDLVLRDLLNYPNPFRDYTNISFAHNKPGVDMDITVDIFTLGGKLVSTIKAKEAQTGFRSQNIYWDGSGAQDGESVYIYRIRVSTSEGQSAEKSGKLILTK